MTASEAGHREPVDTTTLEELDIYAMNTSELYPQRQAIEQNVRRRIRNGSYDPIKAPKLWSYWVESASRMYAQEFGEGRDWNLIFNAATREALANRLARREYAEIKLQMENDGDGPRSPSRLVGRLSEPAGREHDWPRPGQAREDAGPHGALDWKQVGDSWQAKTFGGAYYKILPADGYQTYYVHAGHEHDLGKHGSLGAAMGAARRHEPGQRRAAETPRRKMEDEYVLQGTYGHGWEDLTAEKTWDEIKQRRKEYRDNEGGNYRVIHRRVPVDGEAAVDEEVSEAGERVPVVHEAPKEVVAVSTTETVVVAKEDGDVIGGMKTHRGIGYEITGKTFQNKRGFRSYRKYGYRAHLGMGSNSSGPIFESRAEARAAAIARINEHLSNETHMRGAEGTSKEDFANITMAEQHAYTEGFRFIAAHGRKQHHIYKRRAVGKKGYEKRTLFFRRGKWHISGDRQIVSRLGKDARAIKVSSTSPTIAREDPPAAAPVAQEGGGAAEAPTFRTEDLKKGDEIRWSDAILASGKKNDPKWYERHKDDRGVVDYVKGDGYALVYWDGENETTNHPLNRLALVKSAPDGHVYTGPRPVARHLRESSRSHQVIDVGDDGMQIRSNGFSHKGKRMYEAVVVNSHGEILGLGHGVTRDKAIEKAKAKAGGIAGEATEANELRRVNGRWAFVSKHTGKPLAYYRGSGKPSKAWTNKQERRVQFFKRQGREEGSVGPYYVVEKSTGKRVAGPFNRGIDADAVVNFEYSKDTHRVVPAKEMGGAGHAAVEEASKKKEATKENPAEPMDGHCAVIVERGDGTAQVQRAPECTPTGIKLDTARDVWDLLHKRYAKVGHEMFEVLLVSNQGELIGSPITVATGQPDRVTVDIEQITGPIIARVQDGAAGGGARGFIVSHVHPSSGHYARPSASDKRLTDSIREAAKIGCPSTAFIDHVVVCPHNSVGDGEYYSFTEGKSYKVAASN